MILRLMRGLWKFIDLAFCLTSPAPLVVVLALEAQPNEPAQ